MSTKEQQVVDVVADDAVESVDVEVTETSEPIVEQTHKVERVKAFQDKLYRDWMRGERAEGIAKQKKESEEAFVEWCQEGSKVIDWFSEHAFRYENSKGERSLRIDGFALARECQDHLAPILVDDAVDRPKVAARLAVKAYKQAITKMLIDDGFRLNSKSQQKYYPQSLADALGASFVIHWTKPPKESAGLDACVARIRERLGLA